MLLFPFFYFLFHFRMYSFILFLEFSFLCEFRATQNLASSTVSSSLGYWSLSTVYISFAIGSGFLAGPFIAVVGAKWSLFWYLFIVLSTFGKISDPSSFPLFLSSLSSCSPSSCFTFLYFPFLLFNSGGVGYMPFVISFLHPRMYTLIPSAVVLGLAASTLWSAHGIHFET